MVSGAAEWQRLPGSKKETNSSLLDLNVAVTIIGVIKLSAKQLFIA